MSVRAYLVTGPYTDGGWTVFADGIDDAREQAGALMARALAEDVDAMRGSMQSMEIVVVDYRVAELSNGEAVDVREEFDLTPLPAARYAT